VGLLQTEERKGREVKKVLEREGQDACTVHTDTHGGRQNNHTAWVTLFYSQSRFTIDVGRKCECGERERRVGYKG